MKAIIKIFALFIFLSSVTWIAPQRSSAQVSVNFQVFYDDLSPYGNWINNPQYGYVWIPDISSEFTPYNTNGYWLFTDEGWTWFSNYSWGWAPFHYGRWLYDPYYGWQWVPDNQWGPGWVTWRRSEDYYGWAPIGPGISIDVAYSNSYNLPYNQWTFVKNKDFGRTNINNYYVRPSGNIAIINSSTVINNIHTDRSGNARFSAGPDRTDVEKFRGKTFTPVTVKESGKRGERLSKGELQIYRPQVEKNNSGSQKLSPSKVANLKDLRPVTAHGYAETQTQKKSQPDKTAPIQRQRIEQPIKQRPEQKRNDPPAKQQHTTQSPKQQPVQRQRIEQPVKQRPEQKRNDPPAKQQHTTQSPKQQPVQRQRTSQPMKQPVQQKHTTQPAKHNPSKKENG